jgi:hypothetical protein
LISATSRVIGQYTEVIEGVAQNSLVPRSSYSYFKFTLLKKQRLIITVAPTVRGDPDLYVTTDVSQKPPGRDNYQWAKAQTGSESLVIADAEAKDYYIGIYGYGSDTEFQLIVNTEEKSDLLVDSVTQRVTQDQPTQYKYFRYVHADPYVGVTFTADPEQSTQIELYSAFKNTRPDSGKYEKKGVSVADDINARVINYNGPLTTGTYYISVVAPSASSSYSFRINAITNQSYVVLRDSIPMYSQRAHFGIYRYYTYTHFDFDTQDLSITANPVSDQP